MHHSQKRYKTLYFFAALIAAAISVLLIELGGIGDSDYYWHIYSMRLSPSCVFGKGTAYQLYLCGAASGQGSCKNRQLGEASVQG